ncbi:MAG TPA: ribokinase [Candidatus Dormibacteraeota bacterium]|jgi:ribokinase|nr:ribokinase [Candidatus Dormibacteraeota bacterium]
MPHIVVVGSLNQDLFAYVEHLPRRGETLHARHSARQLGGKGFNQAVGIRRLGVDVDLVGAVGDDAAGETFVRTLDGFGIGRTGLRRLEGSTGLALITVDEGGENTIVLDPGVNHSLTPEMLDDSIAGADAVLVQGELRPETTIRVMDMAKGLKVVNPAPAGLELSPAIARADVVVVNEGEASDLGGTDRLRALGAATVVVTLGQRGSQIDNTVIPAPRVVAVDSTGAGDAFCAALTVALVEGRPIDDSIAWANRAGAAACLRHGSSEALPTRDEVDRLRF